MYIKILNGTICTNNAEIDDPDDFVANLLDKLTDVIESIGCEWCVGLAFGEDVQKEIENTSQKDSQNTHVNAVWLNTNDDNKKRCSNCDIIHFIAQYPSGDINWCPNCGAKMKWEESNDGDTKHS